MEGKKKKRERTKDVVRAERGEVPPQEQAERPVSWVEFAKQQEAKVEAAEPEAEAPSAPATSGKRKRKRARAAEPQESGVTANERKENFGIPKAEIRKGTVQFDGEEDAGLGGSATSSSTVGLRPGSIVRLVGLQGSVELNGRQARCVRWDAARTRWLVNLDDGSEKLLRTQNLQPAADKQHAELRVGASVRLVGLQAAPELNGKLATCVSWSAQRGRWLVRIEGGEEKNVKAQNLELRGTPTLSVGASVRISGLIASPELNGSQGCCVRWDGAKGRWLVRLREGLEKLLRPENLKLEACPNGPLPAVDDSISQMVYTCSENEKAERLLRLLRAVREEEKRGKRHRSLTVVFCNKAKAVESVAKSLAQAQLHCAALHGQTPEAKRARLLSEFKLEGKRILVTTGEGAKGVTFQHLGSVFNYDFPSSVALYCQRLGHLDRDVEAREAHSFLTRRSAPLAKDLVDLLERVGARVEPGLREMVAEDGEVAKETERGADIADSAPLR